MKPDSIEELLREVEVVKVNLLSTEKITQAEQDFLASSGRTGGGHWLWLVLGFFKGEYNIISVCKYIKYKLKNAFF